MITSWHKLRLDASGNKTKRQNRNTVIGWLGNYRLEKKPTDWVSACHTIATRKNCFTEERQQWHFVNRKYKLRKTVLPKLLFYTSLLSVTEYTMCWHLNVTGRILQMTNECYYVWLWCHSSVHDINMESLHLSQIPSSLMFMQTYKFPALN